VYRRENGGVAIDAVPEKTDSHSARLDWICGADTEQCEAGRASRRGRDGQLELVDVGSMFAQGARVGSMSQFRSSGGVN
jgi:hypothetical protein